MYEAWPTPSQPWQSNVLQDYQPPRKSARLRDCNDKTWRPFAEKSMLLYQQLITKYTRPHDTVADLFGGTFASAIAAHSLDRRFVGTPVQGGHRPCARRAAARGTLPARRQGACK